MLEKAAVATAPVGIIEIIIQRIKMSTIRIIEFMKVPQTRRVCGYKFSLKEFSHGCLHCFYFILQAGAIVNELQTQDMEISSENSTPTSEHYTSSMASQHHQMMDVHIPQSSASGPGPPVTSSCSMTPKLMHCVSRAEVSLIRVYSEIIDAYVLNKSRDGFYSPAWIIWRCCEVDLGSWNRQDRCNYLPLSLTRTPMTRTWISSLNSFLKCWSI